MDGGVALAHLRISFRLVYRTPEVRRRKRKILPNMGGKEGVGRGGEEDILIVGGPPFSSLALCRIKCFRFKLQTHMRKKGMGR